MVFISDGNSENGAHVRSDSFYSNCLRHFSAQHFYHLTYVPCTCPRAICPRSPDPFYMVTYNIKWVETSWTDSKYKKSD